MKHLPIAKLQPVKSYRPGIFTDTGKMHTIVARQYKSVHSLELHKYLIQPTFPATVIVKTILAQRED